MSTSPPAIGRVDCAMHGTPDAARRALMSEIRKDVNVIVLHQPGLVSWWPELARIAYESGHDVHLVQGPAPRVTA